MGAFGEENYIPRRMMVAARDELFVKLVGVSSLS